MERRDDRAPRGARPGGRSDDRSGGRGGDRGDRRGPPRGRDRGDDRRGDKGDRPEKPRRKIEGFDARLAALDVLRLVRRGDSLDKALFTCRSFAALEGPDRALARNIASTVLRRQGSLDEVIETYLREPLTPKQDELRAILRIVAAQILILGTPPHAAGMIGTQLAKERQETQGYARLVNAIGRRIAENGPERLAKASVRADTPGWLWRRIERAYGPKAARAIAEAHRQTPPLDVTVRGDADEWATLLEADRVGPVTVRRGQPGRVETLEGYDAGAWWVQDLAASLPVLLMGDVTDLHVLDLCAAPGGKTMQLCARGADVTAVDASEGRMRLVERNLERTKLSARLITADVLDFEPDRLADAVLLDAPCTATGTARRNPDVTWTKTEELASGLAKLQDRMIDRAVACLKPGGTLVFSTCSLLPLEGEERAQAALERHERLERVPVTPEEVGGLKVVNRDGDLRCHPGKTPSMDGFFAARFTLKG